jgi:hypothetical protein
LHLQQNLFVRAKSALQPVPIFTRALTVKEL